ncbi:RNA-directed DNA polymerase [Pseudorhizobium flavum]|uniref:RNA-directed DNA polymerase n=1 Tax=Pseudorhizobium flavum TaxID=1335061 RepID=UPI00376F73C4
MLRLNPTIEDASKDYVLVQAWKKACNYIRYHNWFADTLELDYHTANLPGFLESVSDDMRSGDWVSDPLRLVQAPKSQGWEVSEESGLWGPKPSDDGVQLRPLAHVSLRDQVAATAIMLCLADLVETVQGDPRPPKPDGTTFSTISYGNRLFCDVADGILQHRWGSSKLYRAFSQDYQSFVERPERVAENLRERPGRSIVVVQSDLSQFYDRVRPHLLFEKLEALLGPGVDQRFMTLVRQVLSWRWHEDDWSWAERYAAAKGIDGFHEICLPQGLVSAGFFANVALLNFDRALLDSTGMPIGPGVLLHDSCRYVDDLRLVVTASKDIPPVELERTVFEHLQHLLQETAPGLEPSERKTQAANVGGEVRPLLRQSRKMARIQQSVSGGFDIARGEEIIDAVQSLLRAQEHYSRELPENKERATRNGRDKRLPVPDVKDATVARFAAARFRSTYRSLRPLLFDADGEDANPFSDMSPTELGKRVELTKGDLDEEARNFALNLIQSWIENPSNVRLLRIGLDIWPSVAELDDVLQLLRPYLTKDDSPERQVALYSLSEILKAGATETGFVRDDECLPSRLDLAAYRDRLAEEAILILQLAGSLPWYLNQQALLAFTVLRRELHQDLVEFWEGIKLGAGTDLYLRFMRFLGGDFTGLSTGEFATFAIMSRRSILDKDGALHLAGYEIDEEILQEIAVRDPGFANELQPKSERRIGDPETLFATQQRKSGWIPLADIFDESHGLNLRHEVGVISLLAALAAKRAVGGLPSVITPHSLEVLTARSAGHDRIKEVRFVSATSVSDGPVELLYRPPAWCTPEERWRFQFGYLARFLLTGLIDFTQVPRPSWREKHPVYRPVRSHWYQRTYGLHSGLEGFGDDWLPISEDTENLLYSLLAWPGCRERYDNGWLQLSPGGFASAMSRRLREARKCIGTGTQTLMLKVSAPLFNDPENRPLKGCVVQTVTPHEFDVADLTKSDIVTRKKHRKHLTSALAAVEKMLDLRATHENVQKRLDWLILPELAVHPEDVDLYLVPFARRHKAMVLTGVTYQHVVAGLPAVNSAMWILPQIVPGRGLQMKKRRQGKANLAAAEKDWEALGLVRKFRPCQWLVGYEWDRNPNQRPLWLSAAVCYDSTDLGLAADLRKLSDVFAIPALNKDVGTFDQMAVALHYHMYQMVIIANNGRYGGSNAHLPKKEHYVKQMFHTHGQPQASISFFEIKDIGEMIYRRHLGLNPAANSKPEDIWKYPPANYD